jgi:hypothetical protein
MSPVTRFQCLRGTTAQRISFIQLAGELIFDTDLEMMFVGNGTTYGGIPFSGELGTPNIVTYTADQVLTVEDYALANSASAIQFTLPDATGYNKAIKIKNINSGVLTVVGFSGQLIDGETDIQLVNTNAMELVPEDGAWYIF